MRADMLFAELTSDFGGELVVGGGPFREPPTVMQSTVSYYYFAPSFPPPPYHTLCPGLTRPTRDARSRHLNRWGPHWGTATLPMCRALAFTLLYN